MVGRRVQFNSKQQVQELMSLAAWESLYAPLLDRRGHQHACTGERDRSLEDYLATFLNQAPYALSGRGRDLSPGSSPSHTTLEQGQKTDLSRHPQPTTG